MAEYEERSLALMTADIVAAYVQQNKIPAGELGSLISSIHAALTSAGAPESVVEETTKASAAQIRKSITPDALISFEDGQPYKSLRRHLSVRGLSPEDYKAKWGLPKDYPIVAPAYSAQRSALAKSLGLGRKAAPPVKKGRKPKA